MKRILAVVLAAAALILTGCSDSDYESQTERIDRLYAECLAAGGSFEYNGSLPYWNCEMPEGAR